MLFVCILFLWGFGLYILLKPPTSLNNHELSNHILQEQQLSDLTKIDRMPKYEKAHISEIKK